MTHTLIDTHNSILVQCISSVVFFSSTVLTFGTTNSVIRVGRVCVSVQSVWNLAKQASLVSWIIAQFATTVCLFWYGRHHLWHMQVYIVNGMMTCASR